MLAILLTLLLAAAPFWEAKGPAAWSEDELNQLLTESPWAQVAEGPSANLPGVQVYLATAKPIQLAEAERELANRRLEEALMQLKAAQSALVERERLSALGQMATGIAHDLNNALSPILGFVELIRAGRATQDEQRLDR